MQLVEQGRLALDDSVRKFLPDLPARYDPVTIRRLLSHQSGIREYAGLEEVFSTRCYGTQEEAARAIFLDSPLLFPPGTKIAYTTYGYTLLGAVIEKVTGLAFHQVRLPAGFGLDDYSAITPGRVRPYRRNTSRTGWENAPSFDASNKYPGGGLISSAIDYARFLISVGSGSQLRKDTIETMWTRQRLSDGSVVPFATLGWATGIRGKHRYFTHGGLQPGTTTLMHWFPSIGSGSVILSNAEGPDLNSLQDSILKVLLAPQR